MKRLRVVVDDRLRVLLSDLRDALGDAGAQRLIARFRHKNPAWGKARGMGFAASTIPREVETFASADGGRTLTLPRGGTMRLRAACEEAGVVVTWVDRRTRGDVDEGERIPEHCCYDSSGRRVPLWPHQERSIEAVVRRENCLVRAPTASGKTTSALALASRLQVYTLVVVWTESLLKQWTARACKELGYHPRDIGVIHGPKRVLRPITIAMQQTLAAQGVDEEVRSTFGLVIVDEVQRAPADTFRAVIDPIPARYRVGVSANETRFDGMEFLTYDMFGEVVDAVSREELEALGVVVGVRVVLLPTSFSAPWYSRESSFSSPGRFSAAGGERVARLKRELAADAGRNDLIVRTVLAEAERGSQALVFTALVDHARYLDRRLTKKRIRTGLLIGGKRYSQTFDESAEALRSGECRVGVGTIQAIGTGNDFPRVSVGVLAHPIKNRQQFGQVRGRICRAFDGKSEGILYVIHDEGIVGKTQVRNLLKWNGGSVFVRVDGVDVPAKEYLRRKR